jgi:hypothetical protein
MTVPSDPTDFRIGPTADDSAGRDSRGADASNPGQYGEQLSPADAIALDSLIECGFDISAFAPDQQERARRVMAVLGLLDTPRAESKSDASRSALIDRTVKGITSHSAQSLTDSVVPSILCGDDEEALDAYVAAGFRVDRVSSSLRDRAARLESIGTLLTSASAGSVLESQKASLVTRTMMRIAATPMRVPHDFGSGRFNSTRLADVLSVAAAAVLGVSVLWPVLSAWRTRSTRLSCGANMATVALGMGSYANDYRDQLPVASASLAGPTWWDVGTAPGRSNSANLFQLPKLQYTRLTDLACAGNPGTAKDCACDSGNDWKCAENVSYSYQVMFSQHRPQWGERRRDSQAMRDTQAMVVLADKSPVIARSRAKQIVNPLENSPNHGGDGQWALRTDGSAAWLSTPEQGEDNIWLPAFFDDAVSETRQKMRDTNASFATLQIMLVGNEIPERAGNTFLGP